MPMKVFFVMPLIPQNINRWTEECLALQLHTARWPTFPNSSRLGKTKICLRNMCRQIYVEIKGMGIMCRQFFLLHTYILSVPCICFFNLLSNSFFWSKAHGSSFSAMRDLSSTHAEFMPQRVRSMRHEPDFPNVSVMFLGWLSQPNIFSFHQEREDNQYNCAVSIAHKFSFIISCKHIEQATCMASSRQLLCNVSRLWSERC